MHTCPSCGEPYGLLDAREAVPHHIARRLQSWVYPVTGAWCLMLLVAALAFGLLYHPDGGRDERGIGWMLLFLPGIPAFVLSAISWMFPNVRVFHCRHCGYEAELVLRQPRRTDTGDEPADPSPTGPVDDPP